MSNPIGLEYPRLVVELTRFSSAVGYGYDVRTYLVDHAHKTHLIIRKSLHCVYGDRSGLQSGDVSIQPETLKAVQAFLGEDNFWGKTIRKPISFDSEWAMVLKYKL